MKTIFETVFDYDVEETRKKEIVALFWNQLARFFKSRFFKLKGIISRQVLHFSRKFFKKNLFTD